jgi:hypothetical protein
MEHWLEIDHVVHIQATGRQLSSNYALKNDLGIVYLRLKFAICIALMFISSFDLVHDTARDHKQSQLIGSCGARILAQEMWLAQKQDISPKCNDIPNKLKSSQNLNGFDCIGKCDLVTHDAGKCIGFRATVATDGIRVSRVCFVWNGYDGLNVKSLVEVVSLGRKRGHEGRF